MLPVSPGNSSRFVSRGWPKQNASCIVASLPFGIVFFSGACSEIGSDQRSDVGFVVEDISGVWLFEDE